jgi:MinD-like ATPase involved in chromosome partitioning or flagellar assembly
VPVVVLVVAAGAAWESAAIGRLNETSGIVVLKRCVDVDDLLAAASAGQSDVAVVSLDAPGLDRAAVDHLLRHGVVTVAVAPASVPADAARLRATRVGVRTVLAEGDLDALPAAVTAAAEPAEEPGPVEEEPTEDEPAVPLSPATPGRVVVVWGPPGAPGRTTIATGLAAELGRRRLRTTLVDADPVSASVAQQLGVLDEVSGLLSAARLAAGGALDEGLPSVQRALDRHLTVVTGLPRPDRWTEVRPGVVEHLLDLVRAQGHVVVDTGPVLEDDLAGDLGSRPSRHQLTLEALDTADEVLVVGSADPVGLSRLARGLVELRERLPGTPVRVVVNRMRGSLGWSESDVADMVAGFVRHAGLYVVPDDRPTVDRALVAGSTLVAQGDAPVVRAIATIADALVGPDPTATGRRGARRRGLRRRAAPSA